MLCTKSLCTESLFTESLCTESLFTESLCTESLFTESLCTESVCSKGFCRVYLCTECLNVYRDHLTFRDSIGVTSFPLLRINSSRKIGFLK